MSPTRTLDSGAIGRRLFERALVLVLLIAGIVVTLWPIGVSARSTLVSTRITAFHEAEVAAVPAPALDAAWDAAHAYNAVLPVGALNDPWDSDSVATDDAHDAYLAQLDPLGDGIIGRITIARIDVDLPIRHDTDWDVMRNGAGHMYGTSLPVGGPGTHAVIAAHTEWIGRTFFDRLPELSAGDSFTLSVLGRDLVYEVDQIAVVDPDDLEQIQRLDGADLVTLVTCQWGPDGELSKRLLVRGHRIEGASAPTGQDSVSVQTITRLIPGYAPWMDLRLSIASGALLLILVIIVGWWRSDRRCARTQRAQADRPGAFEQTAPDHIQENA